MNHRQLLERCGTTGLVWLPASLALQLCRSSGAEAAASADRAKAAADSAASAVTRCKLAVQDALVSAEAESAASKAGERCHWGHA